MCKFFAVMGEETWAGGMAAIPPNATSIQEKRNVPSPQHPQNS